MKRENTDLFEVISSMRDKKVGGEEVIVWKERPLPIGENSFGVFLSSLFLSRRVEFGKKKKKIC